MSWIAAFLATTAGKAAAGTVLAAASVGGLHAADVVDFPALPDEASGPAEEAEDIESSEIESVELEADEAEDTEETEAAEAPEDLPEEAVAGQATAEAKQDAAAAFTAAMQEWTDCVATNAEAAQDGEVDENFDPREACGDRPVPSDFGLTALPSQANEAAEAGSANAENGTENSETGTTNSEAGTENSETGTENSETGTEASTEGRSTGDTAREEQGDPTDGGSETPAPEDAGSADPSDRGENAPGGRP